MEDQNQRLIFTIEADGVAILSIEASDARQAEEYARGQRFRDELESSLRLSAKRLVVRKATKEEALFCRKARLRATREGELLPNDGNWGAFLLKVT